VDIMVEGGSEGEAARPVRVVAFEDHPVCAKGLRLTLADAREVVELLGVHESLGALNGVVPADVALVTPELRDGSRLADNVTALRERGVAVLIFTERCDVLQLADALELGASGVVCKYHPEEVLLEGIRKVHEGGSYLPDDVAQLLADGEAQRPRLSTREVEVLNLLYQGLITKQAARRLQVSESTVKEHLKRIRQKYATLGRTVSTRVQLLQIAHRDGFISADGVPEE
jgi:DNA-binding NarL/FixJ family response regulator